MLVLHVPGFLAEEQLPASMDVAIAYQVSAIEAAVGPHRPLILAGYSTGGAFAYILAQELEAAGRRVSAVVLLDTYPPGPGGVPDGQLSAIVQHLRDNRDWRDFLNETRLTAMGWYTSALTTVDLRPVEAPTLLLRAMQPMAAVDDGDWRASWPFPHEARDTPGDHYSMMQLHAGTAAQTVESWLGLTLGGSVQDRVLTRRRAS
jgi:thioesterase domain-containing protein